LAATGFEEIIVSPRQIYADGSAPRQAEAFNRKTFTAMIEGIRGEAIEQGVIAEEQFDRGITALNASAKPDGTFAYTFFKAVCVAPSV
jgi:hypothetical protein